MLLKATPGSPPTIASGFEPWCKGVCQIEAPSTSINNGSNLERSYRRNDRNKYGETSAHRNDMHHLIIVACVGSNTSTHFDVGINNRNNKQVFVGSDSELDAWIFDRRQAGNSPARAAREGSSSWRVGVMSRCCGSFRPPRHGLSLSSWLEGLGILACSVVGTVAYPCSAQSRPHRCVRASGLANVASIACTSPRKRLDHIVFLEAGERSSNNESLASPVLRCDLQPSQAQPQPLQPFPSRMSLGVLGGLSGYPPSSSFASVEWDVECACFCCFSLPWPPPPAAPHLHLHQPDIFQPGFDERDAQICLPSEVSPKRRPAGPARPAPARAKPRAREPLPAAVAPTFCLDSEVLRDGFVRETFRASPPRRKLPSRGRLRASMEPTTSSDVFVSDVGRLDPVPVASMQPSDLPTLSLDRGDRGKSFKDEDAADDLRGIVSLDVNVDTPASVTLEIPSKAESSPIDKEEDMLRELQQLAASVQPATESSSDSDIEGTGTPDARLVITQDPRGHGSSAQAPAPAKPIAPTDMQDLPQASSGRRESEDVLDILEQLSEDSLEVEEDEDAEDEEEEEEEGEDGEEGEEEEEESEVASATR